MRKLLSFHRVDVEVDFCTQAPSVHLCAVPGNVSVQGGTWQPVLGAGPSASGLFSFLAHDKPWWQLWQGRACSLVRLVRQSFPWHITKFHPDLGPTQLVPIFLDGRIIRKMVSMCCVLMWYIKSLSSTGDESARGALSWTPTWDPASPLSSQPLLAL